ncbi:MAG TPA: cytochrome b/b6 domain-containing protein [Burkholderiales bacterium]|jgi:cytochrome b
MREREPEAFQFAPQEYHVPVWDLGVRFFHWALVLLVTGSVVTIKMGKLDLHVWCGYGVLALLIFRILWGFIGGTHARFGSFIAGPGKVFAYMKGMFSREGHESGLGHNPVGALSVLAMLLVLLFQAVSGLFTNDEDFSFEGPLYKWAGNALSNTLTSLHRANQWVIYALVALHVLAILFYALVHRENLVKPMISGYRKISGRIDDAAATSRHGSALAAVIVLALAAVAVYFLVNAVKLTGGAGG